jgi:tRNA(adenine34) deaminase
MGFTKKAHDERHMRTALLEGSKALLRGDFPVGAVLVIDGMVVGKTNNTLLSKKTWGDHAETRLLLEHSELIRKRKTENQETVIELYSTLEPCLMCFGCAAMHRVTRIIFSLHDPFGGVTHIDKNNLPIFYKNSWPSISSGVFREDSYGMFYQFIDKQTSTPWMIAKKLFEEMKADWE